MHRLTTISIAKGVPSQSLKRSLKKIAVNSLLCMQSSLALLLCVSVCCHMSSQSPLSLFPSLLCPCYTNNRPKRAKNAFPTRGRQVKNNKTNRWYKTKPTLIEMYVVCNGLWRGGGLQHNSEPPLLIPHSCAVYFPRLHYTADRRAFSRPIFLKNVLLSFLPFLREGLSLLFCSM